MVGIELARVVAVVCELPNGQVQVGSGFLVDAGTVLTAAHCTWDVLNQSKTSVPGSSQRLRVRVVQATTGLECGDAPDARLLLGDPWDVAVLTLVDSPWARTVFPSVAWARIEQSYAGELTGVVGIGYPLFQRDPKAQSRRHMELHAMVRRTNEAEMDRLLIHDPTITPGPLPPGGVTEGRPPSQGVTEGSPWGGMSGTVLFYAEHALAVVVEHHKRQGATTLQATQLASVVRAVEADPTRDEARRVVERLGLPGSHVELVDAEELARLGAAMPLQLLSDLPLQRGDLPIVSGVDPYMLGATESPYGRAGHHFPNRVDGDPYVPRTSEALDERLANAIAAAALRGFSSGEASHASGNALICTPVLSRGMVRRPSR